MSSLINYIPVFSERDLHGGFPIIHINIHAGQERSTFFVVQKILPKISHMVCLKPFSKLMENESDYFIARSHWST